MFNLIWNFYYYYNLSYFLSQIHLGSNITPPGLKSSLPSFRMVPILIIYDGSCIKFNFICIYLILFVFAFVFVMLYQYLVK